MNLRFQHNLLVGTILLTSAFAFSQPKKPATPTQFRTITIVAEPNSRVWIDSVLFGNSGSGGKLEIKSISPGPHVVRVRCDGFKEKTLTLTPIQKGEVKVPLVKTTDEAELTFQDAERLTTVDRQKSAEAYRKAIKLRPNYPEAFVGLARILSETGDLEEAGNAIKSARKLRPGYAEASAVEGRIHKDLAEEDKAVAAFKRAIAEGRGFQPEALTGLGLLYKEKAEGFGGNGNFEQESLNYTEAAKYMRSAIKQLSGAPDAVIVYQLLGLIFERQQKFDDAIALYEEFLSLFPNSNEATAIRSFIEQIKSSRSGQTDH